MIFTICDLNYPMIEYGHERFGTVKTMVSNGTFRLSNIIPIYLRGAMGTFQMERLFIPIYLHHLEKKQSQVKHEKLRKNWDRNEYCQGMNETNAAVLFFKNVGPNTWAILQDFLNDTSVIFPIVF